MLSLKDRLLVYGLDNYEVNDILRIINKEWLPAVRAKIGDSSLTVDAVFLELNKGLLQRVEQIKTTGADKQ